MDIETRLTNLENLVNSLIKRIDKNKFYSDADSAGIRQSVSNITPYTESKTAYIGDTEVVFENVPKGNVTVYSDVEAGMEYTENGIRVFFEPVEEVTTITISII
jgi:hypothetical protein